MIIFKVTKNQGFTFSLEDPGLLLLSRRYVHEELPPPPSSPALQPFNVRRGLNELCL